jgi:hypothetical protein
MLTDAHPSEHCVWQSYSHCTHLSLSLSLVKKNMSLGQFGRTKSLSW